MSDVIDAQRLRAVREARGWDQQTLAQTAGIDPSVISRLERGLQVDLKASVLVALARALAIPIDALVALPEASQPPSLVAELTSVLTDLAPLSAAHQRQVAAILRGYLVAMPE